VIQALLVPLFEILNCSLYIPAYIFNVLPAVRTELAFANVLNGAEAVPGFESLPVGDT
jgi:hypothetical protein